MPQRPNNFTINRNHPLAQGLAFAGLGAHAGSTRYHDSSAYGNHGTLTNMEPGTDWTYSDTLNRVALDFYQPSSQYVLGSIVQPALPMTLSMWIKHAGLASYRTPLQTSYSATAYNGALIGLTNGGAPYSQIGDGAGTDSSHRYSKIPSTTMTAGVWYHVCCIYYSVSSQTVLLNGVDIGGTYSGSAAHMGYVSAAMRMASQHCGNAFSDITASDPMIHARALNLREVQLLADPSNVMLSGLINPPRRKWWPVVSGAAPTFKAAWATKRRQTIGGGVI